MEKETKAGLLAFETRGVHSISKQLACQKYIYKIHSSRLRKERWRLTLPMEEARRNDEVISLADSQMLRWIDELNGVTDADAKAKEIKLKIRELRRSGSNPQIKRQLRRLYKELDAIQFKPDYMCLIIDREKDYYRACRGFSINGIRYRRLLGTNGGIKNSTIVFVSERLHGELSRRVENGRDMNKELVPAKLEAYKALTCSASIPVSMPNGILVVHDCETRFFEDIIYLNDEDGSEPKREFRTRAEIKLDVSDGFGLMMPSLAERWSEELGLGYVTTGVNTRLAWEKGMIYTFDFQDFAEKVAGTYLVKDVWGNEVDIRNVELIFTESMLKLWSSYKSIDDYLQCCAENNYSLCVTKACPAELENERTTNYQFLQGYDLTDEDIDELIRPTMQAIRDALGGDWRKALLFLRGVGMNDGNVLRMDNDYIKAIMADRRVLDDPYVQNNIYRLIRNRINEAKVGVLTVHGNYSMTSGDPYALCQSIFGLEVTGILAAGEIYNKYWSDHDAEALACFRAPMTSHNNVRAVKPHRSYKADYWYRYMKTCTIMNAWDSSCAALNGMDHDGDLVFLTDNHILVSKHIKLPTIMCAQRTATKKIVTEDDIIRSNIASFGNDIGRITNWVTSMFDVRARFDPGSTEYETLTYRIQCGQLLQQNEIDKAKGIISKPMPRSWHDRHAIGKIDDDGEHDLYLSIVADKKPYFMRYIYPALMKQYNTYVKNTNRNALREFQMTVDELISVPPDQRTDRQNEFLRYYERRMPVGTGDCVMNKICRRFEEAFDGYVSKHNETVRFDYRFMRSNAEYSIRQFNAIRRLKDDYNKRLSSYEVFADCERVDEYDSYAALSTMNDEFRKECAVVCPDKRELCNIILDMCYTKNSTKRFAWAMCGDEILRNLLETNGGYLSYPAVDSGGDIQYNGMRFSLKTISAEVID